MSVEIPDELTVYTRDLRNVNEGELVNGISVAELKKLFVDNYIYLWALSEDEKNYFYIKMAEHDAAKSLDISEYNNEDLKNYVRGVEDAGGEVTNSEFYKNGEYRFMVLDFIQQGINIRMYATTNNGKYIMILLNSYDTNISDSNATRLKAIVDSIEFKNSPGSPDIVSEDQDPVYSKSYEIGLWMGRSIGIFLLILLARWLIRKTNEET